MSGTTPGERVAVWSTKFPHPEIGLFETYAETTSTDLLLVFLLHAIVHCIVLRTARGKTKEQINPIRLTRTYGR